mmetsp:Transcript_97736/g.277062  ORF Transcript_97736/g.277062 Transcript_97736/m.277062 type:complete len:348 (+) Transcript_97736:170-1213(+)
MSAAQYIACADVVGADAAIFRRHAEVPEAGAEPAPEPLGRVRVPALEAPALLHRTQVPQPHSVVHGGRVKQVHGFHALEVHVRLREPEARNRAAVQGAVPDAREDPLRSDVPHVNPPARGGDEDGARHHGVVRGDRDDAVARGGLLGQREEAAALVGAEALEPLDVVAGVLHVQLVLVYREAVAGRHSNGAVEAEEVRVLHLIERRVVVLLRRLRVRPKPVEADQLPPSVRAAQSPQARGAVGARREEHRAAAPTRRVRVRVGGAQRGHVGPVAAQAERPRRATGHPRARQRQLVRRDSPVAPGDDEMCDLRRVTQVGGCTSGIRGEALVWAVLKWRTCPRGHVAVP